MLTLQWLTAGRTFIEVKSELVPFGVYLLNLYSGPCDSARYSSSWLQCLLQIS